MFKKILALLLALLCVLSCVVGCTDDGEETEEASGSESSSESSTPSSSYDPNTSILLSGENRYKVIYADGVSKSIALKVYDKLMFLDPAAKTGYYTCTTDKKAKDDGSPEILIGLTNRAASTEAKKALEEQLDFSIVISGNKIAIFANTESRLTDAVNYFNSMVALTDAKEVIYKSKTNYIGKYTPTEVKDIKIAGAPISEFTIIVPSENFDTELAIAESLAEWLIAQTGQYIRVDIDEAEPTAHEILIGKTNRPESSEVTGATLASSEFKTAIKNGKLAIAAGSRTGYNIAVSSMKNIINSNDGAIKEAFTPQILSFDTIKSLTVGAIRFEEKSGSLYFSRYTVAQFTAWKNAGYESGAKTTAGVRLDFETNSSSLYFETPTPSVTFELYLNGEKFKDLKGASKHFVEIDTSENQTNRLTLIFPSHQEGAVSCIQLDGGATVERHKFDKKFLIMGDSITQGWNSGTDSLSYAHLVSRHFNADSVIQGIGGTRFNANALDANFPFDPDVIIIAYGTNDWAAYKNNESTFRSNLTAYLDKIKQLYPDKTIIGISPIERLDSTSGTMSFASACSIIEQEYTKRNVVVVDGSTLVPKDRQYYADDVHPNAKGFTEYAENLVAAIEKYVKES